MAALAIDYSIRNIFCKFSVQSLILHYGIQIHLKNEALDTGNM